MQNDNRSRINTLWADIGAGFGLLLVAFGLYKWNEPLAWIYAGVVLVALSVIAVLPPKTRDDDRDEITSINLKGTV